MKTKYQFPFFGAGDAEYLEFASVNVIFKKTPSESQKKRIENIVPPPINNIKWDASTLTAISGNVHISIAKTYNTKHGLDPKNKKHWDGSWFFADGSQVWAFNEDIERWLNKAHKISPVLLALREEDKEAGGTRFSDWHKWSNRRFISLLPFFDDVVSQYDYDSKKGKIFLDLLKKKQHLKAIGQKYLDHLNPGKQELKDFKKGKIEKLLNIANPGHFEAVIRTFNKNLDEQYKKQLTKYAKTFLSFKDRLSEDTFTKLNEKLFVYYQKDVYSTTFREIADNINNKFLLNKLAYEAWSLIPKKKYLEYRKISEKILQVQNEAEVPVKSGIYINAMWVFLEGNVGIPASEKQIRFILDRCIPKGPENPSIFLNACCLYVQLGEFDNAYEMVRQCLSHFYDKKDLLKELKTEKLFNEFIKTTTVLDFVDNYEEEPKINPKPRFVSESICNSFFNIRYTVFSMNISSFSAYVLINGSVDIEGDFKDTYKPLTDNFTEKDKILVIVNGNLSANAISAPKQVVYIEVMGKINCKNISHNAINEKNEKNFDYIPYYKKNS